jgi:hypothetical protein
MLRILREIDKSGDRIIDGEEVFQFRKIEEEKYTKSIEKKE